MIKANRKTANNLPILSIICVLLISGKVMAEDFPKPGDMAAGAQAWVDNCTRCHNLRPAEDLRDDEWITSMFHMRIRAGLTGKETRDILSFLQASNNAQRKLNSKTN